MERSLNRETVGQTRSRRKREKLGYRRKFLKTAGLAGAGAIIITEGSSHASAKQSVEFVQTGYVHDVEFSEDSNVDKKLSKHHIDVNAEYVIGINGTELFFTRRADKNTKDFVRNSEKVVTVDRIHFNQYPKENIKRTTSDVVVQLHGNDRPTKRFAPVNTYNPSGFDMKAGEGSTVKVHIEDRGHVIDKNSSKSIHLSSLKMRLWVITESGQRKKEKAKVKPRLLVTNNGAVNIKE